MSKKLLSIMLSLTFVSSIIPATGLAAYADNLGDVQALGETGTSDVSNVNENINKFEVKYNLFSNWGHGFEAQITVTNITDSNVNDWTFEFDFDGDITVFYEAEIVSHEGNHYVIKNVGYNNIIEPGQTLVLGFQGTRLGDSATVGNLCLFGESTGNTEGSEGNEGTEGSESTEGSEESEGTEGSESTEGSEGSEGIEGSGSTGEEQQNILNISGSVKEFGAGTGLEGVTILVDGITSYTTDADGKYVIPLTTDEVHTFEIYKDGFITNNYYDIVAQTTRLVLDDIMLLSDEFLETEGTAEGFVSIEYTDEVVPNATVNVREGINNTRGEILDTVVTDEDGKFKTNKLFNGAYTLQVIQDNIQMYYLVIIVAGEEYTIGRLPAHAII